MNYPKKGTIKTAIKLRKSTKEEITKEQNLLSMCAKNPSLLNLMTSLDLRLI